jgi:hypothetical protein
MRLFGIVGVDLKLILNLKMEKKPILYITNRLACPGSTEFLIHQSIDRSSLILSID